MRIFEPFTLILKSIIPWMMDRRKLCERCDGTGVIQVTASYACRCDRCGGSGEA